MRTVPSIINSIDQEISFDPVQYGFFDIPNTSNHTMSASLNKYVEQRVPSIEIIRSLKEGKRIVVYGNYPSDIGVLSSYTGVSEHKFTIHSSDKKLNYIRPRYFHADSHFIILVTPGRDYVAHYTSMFRYIVAKYSNFGNQQQVSVYFNKKTEKSIPVWTDLDSYVEQGDIVIIGYVNEIKANINKYMKFINHNENAYYTMERFACNNKNICLLGVKYSYWGNMSAIIACRLCELGVSEIIYVGKLGDMLDADNLYNKIYSATSFCVMNTTQKVLHICDNSNPLVKLFPELDTGTHVSVPTVLEEQYNQREIAKHIGANSIDNEISQIMQAVYTYNMINYTCIKFFNLHFSTDYVRSKDEKDLHTVFDLSNNKNFSAKVRKKRILEKIARYLIVYLFES